MKLTSQKVLIESFKEQKWIAPLLSILNLFMNDVVNGINGNQITIDDNLYQELKEIEFVNDATNLPLKFNAKFQKNPKALQIIYCYNKTDAVTEAITSLPVWTYTNGVFQISSITGLTASKNYILRIHVIYQ